LFSAAPPGTPEDWERRGNAAFADENYAEAVRCYAHAEERGTEPGRTAFNHGAALFRMGKYRDAERLFRCAVESAAPPDRRAKALYNLGTCLLQSSDGKDARRLAEAVDCFTRCLKVPGLSEAAAADMRHNLELAKVLWRAVRGGSAAPPENDTSSGDDDRPPDKPPENNPGSDPGSQPGTPDPRGTERIGPTPGQGVGPKPTPVPNQPQPGAGQMSPIPADQQMQPLPPREARELLRQAGERILRERRALQRASTPAEAKGYPDW
jgi:tetratricopeptide (TPR) repeat protein